MMQAAEQLVRLGADVLAQNEQNQTSAELAEEYAFDWRISLWLRQVQILPCCPTPRGIMQLAPRCGD